ncbi:putative Methyltransferase type 11 [Verrucomicrobia bacterium]|nr:putative Methyltransferase type 11 [Verrucomicrobiota bacterium]
MAPPSDFWDALAPHLSRIENSYLDAPSIRRIIHDIHQPALVVGAGQGLIVAELQKKGIQCDGVDLSSEMIRYAKIRRGLDLVQADARAMPFEKGTYQTIIFATGVIDFMIDEEQIRVILNEARRIAADSGNIFVAFYRFSAATEDFTIRLGLLRNNVLCLREILEIYRLSPVQTIEWAARRGKVGCFRAAIWSLRSFALSSWQEKRNAFHMQRIFANANRGDTLIQAAPEKQSYRNEAEIRKLFARLAVPIKQLAAFRHCYIVQI